MPNTDTQLPQAQNLFTGEGNNYSLEDQGILDILLEKKLIRQDQYDDIAMKSNNSEKSYEEVLSSLGIVPENEIIKAKAQMLGVPYVSFENTAFSPESLNIIPRSIAERFHLIPFSYDEKNKTVSIAMANPIDLDALQFVRQKTGFLIKVFAASLQEITKAIHIQYQQELVGEVGKALQENQQYEPKTVDSKQIAQIINEAPIAKIVSTILEYAVNSRASDVHIEPMEDRVRVRYRIDGILYDKLTLPKGVQEAFISRIKILSQMKIDERRIPQDGRFNFKTGEQEVDLRISTLPTIFGETVVMRLLRKSGGIPTLAEIGLVGTALKNLETTILKPHGIILVCGPTGSGKTTTLYAILSKLNTTRINIMSLEDPVEYQIPGVNQVQINTTVGLTFATGLRAFLRQDPNIILVGEIRDKETADLALQAALTGHLVFSTLHTASAAGALPRLLDFGLENFLIASTVNALMAQRIVRKICSHCIESVLAPASLIAEMKVVLGSLFPNNGIDLKLSRGKGCAECGNSGYIGRIGIFEILVINEKIAHLVLQHSDEATIETEAIAGGMITVKQDGYLKVLQGLTTIEEVLRVAQK